LGGENKNRVSVSDLNELKDELKNNNVLLLGYHYMGKTRGIIETIPKLRDVYKNPVIICPEAEVGEKEREGAEKEILKGVKDLESYGKWNSELIIVDDFYEVYCECEINDKLRELKSLLLSGKRFCLSTTPYCGEWLYDTWLRKELKDFKFSLKLVYVEEGNAKKLIENFKNQNGEPLIKNHKLELALSKCRFEYNIKKLKKEIARTEQRWSIPLRSWKYSSHVPYALLRFWDFEKQRASLGKKSKDLLTAPPKGLTGKLLRAMGGIKRIPLGEGIYEFLIDIYRHGAEEYIYEAFQDTTTRLLKSLQLIAAPLAVVAVLREMWDREDATAASLKDLFGDFLNMNEIEIEMQEARANVRPRSFSNIRDVLTGENVRKLREDMKNHYNDYNTVFDEIEGELDRIKGFFEEMNKRLEHVEKVADIVDKQVENSTLSIKGIDENVRKWVKEIKILDELKFEGMDKVLKNTMPTVESGRLIIIHGPAGAGKSTLAYKIGEKMEESGDFVAVPNTSKLPWLKWKLDGRIVPAGSRKVLICEYPTMTLYDEEGNLMVVEAPINPLRDLLISKKYDKLIIVCRSESLENLKNELKLPPTTGGAEEKIREFVDKNKKEIQVNGLEEDINGLIGQVEKRSGEEDKISNFPDEIKRKIKEVSKKIIRRVEDGKKVEEKRWNPLVALVASDLAKKTGTIKGTTAHGTLWEKIETVFKDKEAKHAGKLIALTRRIKQSELFKIMEKAHRVRYLPDERAEIIQRIEGYLSKDGELLFFNPDMFGDAVFWKNFIETQEEEFNFYIPYLMKYPGYLPGVAYNLTIAYSAADGKKDRARVVDYANKFLESIKNINSSIYTACLRNLLFGDLPVNPEKINAEKFVEGAEEEAVFIAKALKKHRGYKEVKPEPELAVVNFISILAANHVDAGNNTQVLDHTEELACKSAEKLKEKIGERFDVARFMGNVYSMSISKIAENWKPEEKKEWVEELEKRFKEHLKIYSERSLD